MTEYEKELLKELRTIREALDRIEQYITRSHTDVRDDISVFTAPSSEKIESSIEESNPEQSESIKATVKRYYFGAPDGAGFDECNVMSDPANPRVLYVVETEDDKHGKFYPLRRGLGRLKSNAKAFLIPFCKFSGTIDDIQGLDIPMENYGEVELENGFWGVVRKCIL